MFAAGPDPADELTACQSAADSVPTISSCETLFTTCADYITSDVDTRDYCQSYACSDCGTDGTCSSAYDGVFPTCTCDTGIIGTQCSDVSIPCPASDNGFDCSGHGTCDYYEGNCTCVSEFSGDVCETVSCIHYDADGNAEETSECNNHGTCRSVGVCQCDAGWIGATCTLEIFDAGMSSGQFALAVLMGLFVGTGMCVCSMFMIAGED